MAFYKSIYLLTYLGGVNHVRLRINSDEVDGKNCRYFRANFV